MVAHDALLVAVQAHPVLALTETTPVKPLETPLAEDCDMVGAQDALNANVFDRSLAALPPGPTAVT